MTKAKETLSSINSTNPPRVPGADPHPDPDAGPTILRHTNVAQGTNESTRPTLPIVVLRGLTVSSWFIVQPPNGSELAHVAVQDYLAKQ